jgi:hypothetical protein
MRAVAFATLSGWTGAPFIIEDRLAKSARGRASWSSLALQLQPQELKALMLGVSYEDDPSRWDDAIDKLERFSAEARRQAFDDDGLLSTRCGLLAQLRWFGLVGELLWLPERLDDWEYWRREDGWVVTQTAVDEWRSDRYRTNPFEGSEFTDLGDYLDAMGEDCWRAFDALIAEGDIAYLRSCGIQHSADGRLSFDL